MHIPQGSGSLLILLKQWLIQVNYYYFDQRIILAIMVLFCSIFTEELFLQRYQSFFLLNAVISFLLEKTVKAKLDRLLFYRPTVIMR